MKYYSLDNIDKLDAHYNIVYGERSNGKTTAGLLRILENYMETGQRGAVFRRYDSDIMGRQGAQFFEGIVAMGKVEEITDGEWTNIEYHSRRWFLTKTNPETGLVVKDQNPFCFAFALNQTTRYKSNSFPGITTIVFDEFLAKERELTNEFLLFTSLVSTIVREKNIAKIYLLGNTVSQHSIYFKDMGVSKLVKEMQPGDIRLVQSPIITKKGDRMKIAIEYATSNPDGTSTGKDSDVYFAFDRPELRMVTDGSWEIPMFPHTPQDIKHESIFEYFYIEHEDELYRGDCVHQDDLLYINIRPCTTSMLDYNPEKLTYKMDFNPADNYDISIMRPNTKLGMNIKEMFDENRVYFSDNTTGAAIVNYIQKSNAYNIFTL